MHSGAHDSCNMLRHWPLRARSILLCNFRVPRAQNRLEQRRPRVAFSEKLAWDWNHIRWTVAAVDPLFWVLSLRLMQEMQVSGLLSPR